MSSLLYSHYLARRRTRIPKRWRGGGGLERKRRRRHHLYLVFADWQEGYSVRKVSPSGRRRQAGVRRLPRPFFRMEAVSPGCLASAFGTMIMSMCPMTTHSTDNGLWSCCPGEGTFIPALDVRSRAVAFLPGLSCRDDSIFVAVGDNKLFSLDDKHRNRSFEMISLDPSDPVDPWSRQVLPKPPSDIHNVTSHAAHPDGRSFLVSTTNNNEATAATFAYDTEKLSWKQLSDWALPFAGRGHFDPLLGAFVGLSEDGRLYSCYLPASDETPPLSKLCKEKLLSEDPAERHVGVTLVYMGRRSKFCLVQCVSTDLENKEEPRPDSGLCRLTTFSLSHDMNGDLTTGKSRRVQYYKAPCVQTPGAFWL